MSADRDTAARCGESSFAGVSIPNDSVAGLGVDPESREGTLYGWWFYPLCNRCQEQWGPCSWRHVPDGVLRHVEETGHDDWTLWIFRDLPADYDLKNMGAFTQEVYLHPDRRNLNATRCRDCFRIIRLPKDWDEPELRGMPDPMAMEGDLCDECGQAAIDIGWLEHEAREDERLNERLRRRP